MNAIDPTALGLHVVHTKHDEAYVICPYHHDTTPSASFNMTKGLFVCYACHAKKNAKQLAKDLGGSIIASTVATIEGRFSDEDDGEWKKLLLASTGVKSKYLKHRGVPKSLILRYGIRWTRGKIAFPQYSRELVITGFQIRKEIGQPRYYFAGRRQPVWPMQNLLDAFAGETLYLTEGVFGALRLTRLGNRAVATMGAGSIGSCIPMLQGRKVVVVFDPDVPGLIGAGKLMYTLGCKAVFPPVTADELTPAEWHSIVSDSDRITDDVKLLASAYGDERGFWNIVHKFASMV